MVISLRVSQMVTNVGRCKMRCPDPHGRVIDSAAGGHNNRANQSQPSAARPSRRTQTPKEDCVASNQPETYECDVLVAGSGCSGMSAAITAGHHGLKVLVA